MKKHTETYWNYWRY